MLKFSGIQTPPKPPQEQHQPNESPKVVIMSPNTPGSNETVGDQLLLPEELLHPFMRQPTESQIHDFFSRYSKPAKHKENFEDTPIVGAINRRMFERYHEGTEEVKINSNNDKYPAENKNETVSTIIKMEGSMLKPFFGRLKNKKGELFTENDKSKYEKETYYDGDVPVYTSVEQNLYEPPSMSDESYVSYEENSYL